MRARSGRIILAAVAVCALAAAAPAASPVALKPSPPLAKGIAAFPRIAATPGDHAAERINKTLAGAEQGIGCDGGKGDWNRSVAVTMRGPRYLSLYAMDDYYCGGPYPDTAQTALVFDRTTGQPIDWKALFPKGFIEKSGSGAGNDASQPVTVTSAALWAIYAKAATADLDDKECGQVLADPPEGKGLMLWPDAEADGVDMQATDFPHVVKACGPPETLSTGELRKLGVAPALVAAIATAHKNGWYDKTKK